MARLEPALRETFHQRTKMQALTAYRNAKLFLDVLARSGLTPTPAAFATALKTVEID
jgi:hypothetical protein